MMTNTWRSKYQTEMMGAVRFAWKLSIAATAVLLLYRLWSNKMGGLVGIPFMLVIMLTAPGQIATDLLLGYFFPGWREHAPYIYLMVMAVLISCFMPRSLQSSAF
jgi:hypothetical protein